MLFIRKGAQKARAFRHHRGGDSPNLSKERRALSDRHALTCPVDQNWHRTCLGGAILAVQLSGATCAAQPASDPTQLNAQDVAGLVDIGGGRKLYRECRGLGSPEVILISGKGYDAADWSKVLDPADPAHDALDDLVLAGQGRLQTSASAVFPAVSQFTRDCAYDRPRTRIGGGNTSTPVAQPHSVSQDVSDLSALLTAAHDEGPYVLAANSYGGLIALLYARTHAGRIAGLVMIDSATEWARRG